MATLEHSSVFQNVQRVNLCENKIATPTHTLSRRQQNLNFRKVKPESFTLFGSSSSPAESGQRRPQRKDRTVASATWLGFGNSGEQGCSVMLASKTMELVKRAAMKAASVVLVLSFAFFEVSGQKKTQKKGAVTTLANR